MIIHTTAEGISMARQLENDSTAFYKAAAVKYPELGEALLSFVQENRKFITNIERAYYGVITDAIEGCFALDLETDRYILELDLDALSGRTDFINQSVRNEEKIIRFYLEAGEQSKLMSDVSRSLTLTAKKRQPRLARLSEMLND